MKKYELVADKIKDYITEKQLHHGDKLPTITDLMKKYQVGKSTILQAITLLTEGLSIRCKGQASSLGLPGKMVICL